MKRICGTLAVFSVTFYLLWWFGAVHSPDWRVTTAYTDLPEVSGMQIDGNSIYVTLETRQNDGKIVSLNNGSPITLVPDLQKPDGLATSLGRLIYTQEFGKSPVYEIQEGISLRLFDADGAEGVDSTENGDIFVVEDRKGGRVLKYGRSTGLVTTLASGLDEAEGICAMESGDVYFSEKGRGEVFRIRDNRTELYLDHLSNPAYLYCDESTESVWITEDRRNFGRLLHASGPGDYSVVATGLKSPQSIAFHSADSFLLAEQGRDRILLFQRDAQERFGFDWPELTLVSN